MKKSTLAIALMTSLFTGASWAAQDASAPAEQAQRATAAKGDASAPAEQAQRATAAKGDASAPAEQAQRATAAKGDASAAEAFIAEATPSAATGLNQAVQEAVAKAAAQVGANIQTSVKAGEVTLNGTAPSEEALRRVAEEASRVPGVTSVRTNVTLKAAG